MSAYTTLLNPASMKAPSWRFNLAMKFATDPRLNTSLGCEDLYLQRAIDFYTKYTHKGNDKVASREFPSLYEATQVHMNSRPTGGYRWLLEAALMTTATDEEIASKFQFRYGADTVYAFRKVYFDIDDYRDKKACIVANVLSTSLSNMPAAEDFDYSWKMLCYEFGMDGFEALVDFHAGVPFKRKYADYFKRMTTSRVAYNGFHVSTLRRAQREDAVRTLETAAHFWDIDPKKVEETLTQSSQEAAKQILAVCREQVWSPDIEKKIENTTDAWEGQMNVDYSGLDINE